MDTGAYGIAYMRTLPPLWVGRQTRLHASRM